MSRFKRFVSDDSGLIFVPILIGLALGGFASTGIEVTGNALNANDLNNSATVAHETSIIIREKAGDLSADEFDKANAIADGVRDVGKATREDAKTEVISGVKTIATDAALNMLPGGKVGGSVLKAAAKRSTTVRTIINTTVRVAPAGSKAKEAIALKEAIGTLVLKGTGAEDVAKEQVKGKLDTVEGLLRGDKAVTAPEAGSDLENAIVFAKLQAAGRLVGQNWPGTDPQAAENLAVQILLDAERDKSRIKPADDPALDGAAGANALADLWGKLKDAAGDPYLQRLQEALAKLQAGGPTGGDGAKAEVRGADLSAVKDGSVSSAIGVVWDGETAKPAIIRSSGDTLEVELVLEPGAPIISLKEDLTLDVPDFAGEWKGTYGLRVDVPGYGSAVTKVPVSFTVNPDGSVAGTMKYNGPVKVPGMPGGARVTYKMSGKVTGQVTGDTLKASGPFQATATINVSGFSRSADGGANVKMTGTFSGNDFTGKDQRGQKITASR